MKKTAILYTGLAMILCLMTACGGASTAGKPADNEEIAQEMSGEENSADKESADGRKEQDSEGGGPVSEQEEAGPETEKPDSGKPDSETPDSEKPDSETPVPETEEIVFGDEQFEEYLPLLEGKRVALFTNQTGIVGDKVVEEGASDADVTDDANEAGTATAAVTSQVDTSLIPFGKDAEDNDIVYGQHILDALVGRGVQVEAVFCPEHGFRGTQDAGAEVEDDVDEETGVPIVSLYGSGKRGPDAADMDRFDILVVDIQEVGLRYYTYYITMYRLMDACAAAGKEVLILDRPNPNGFYVDGPILQDDYKSGVGVLPLPVVYGLTLGELAGMINGEGWLDSGEDACDLTVIPCRNYTHRDKIPLIRRPSPNLRDMRAVYLYSSTCFFENTLVSVGRGTENPFEIYGSPYLEDVDGFEFSFTPQSISGASNPPFEGETCWGVDLREVPIEDILGAGINVSYLVEAYHAVTDASPGSSFWGSPDGSGQYWIDKLSGSSELRLMIEEGATAEEIKESWQEDVSSFLERRKPYLLYERFASKRRKP